MKTDSSAITNAVGTNDPENQVHAEIHDKEVEQVESPLLKRIEEEAPELNEVSSPRRLQRTENDVSNEDAGNESSPITTARRSSLLSGSQNSGLSILEDETPASSPFLCQPSASFIGSLNGTVSDIHLPLLTKETRARLKALKAAPTQHLEVTIDRSDELPFGTSSHPQVRVHIIDRCTGRAICPAQMTTKATFRTISDQNDTFSNVVNWHQALEIPIDLPSFLHARTVLLFEIVEMKAMKKKGVRRSWGKRFEALSTHDEDDTLKSQLRDFRRIAWGFFHPITSNGTPTVNSFVLPKPLDATNEEKQPIVNVIGLRLRLFEYQMLTWMDKYQAKVQWGWRKNHPNVPAVFLQYQKRHRCPASTTLHIQLKAVIAATSRSPDTMLTTSTGRNIEQNEQQATDVGNQDQVDDVPPTIVDTTGAPRSSSLPKMEKELDFISACERHSSEPCLIPQQVLFSLPSGKKGCSTIAFSQCGQYLAAGVSPELGAFVIKVYDLKRGNLFAVGRGHRGVIYSLEWYTNDSKTGSTQLLSTSSDGTVRMWNVPHSIPSTNRKSCHLSLVFQWHHFPCFVYCGIFHPGSNGKIVVTGSSDGCIRFRKEFSSLEDQAEYAVLQVSSAAVQSICIELKTERLFCGDAKGEVTVWRRIPNSSALCSYEKIKILSTGQTGITSLRLHPRKAHLLVHTQPNAIFQYELRSYLLLNKKYEGVISETLLVKSTFSPDGKFVISGSEDGVPRLYTSLHGQQLQRGVWGLPFFHTFPLLDVTWSPTAHMAALCSYGGDNPIIVLCSRRDGKEAALLMDETTSKTTPQLQPPC